MNLVADVVEIVVDDELLALHRVLTQHEFAGDDSCRAAHLQKNRNIELFCVQLMQTCPCGTNQGRWRLVCRRLLLLCGTDAAQKTKSNQIRKRTPHRCNAKIPAESSSELLDITRKGQDRTWWQQRPSKASDHTTDTPIEIFTRLHTSTRKCREVNREQEHWRGLIKN